MKKPNIEDYINMNAYAISLIAYIDHIESVNADLLDTCKSAISEIQDFSGANTPVWIKLHEAIEKATK